MRQPVLTYLFFFCLVLITAACKDDRLPASSVEKEGGSNVYVSIVVNTEDSLPLPEKMETAHKLA